MTPIVSVYVSSLATPGSHEVENTNAKSRHELVILFAGRAEMSDKDVGRRRRRRSRRKGK